LAILTGINERAYGALMELADVREELGDAAGAADALDRAIYIYPYEATLHTRLATLNAEIGADAKAIRERQAVLALDPVDRADALYQLARAYYEARDMTRARRTVLRALEIAPSFEYAQDLLLEIRAGGGGTQP
jgi:tetratricopeptide (TPR) repeat protein